MPYRLPRLTLPFLVAVTLFSIGCDRATKEGSDERETASEEAARTDSAKTSTQPQASTPAPEAPPPFLGTYEGAVPAASGTGRRITLTLLADGTARMSTDPGNGEPATEEPGEWRWNKKELMKLYVGTKERERSMIFEVQGDSLVATEYDKGEFASGLGLRRR